MGEIADQIIDQMFDHMFDYDDDDEMFGFYSRGIRHRRPNFQNEKGIWRDRNGNSIPIKDISTTHIMNAMRFADNYKIRELEDELEERKRIQVTPYIPKPKRVGTK